jgi:ElaB/YqjD/DUF883 family membrane-anchored ribosome-binding protein
MSEEIKKEGEAAASAEKGFLDKVKDKLEDLKDKAEDAWEKVEDKAEAIWDKVEDKAEDVWDAAKEKAADLKDKIVDTFDGDDKKPTEEKK